MFTDFLQKRLKKTMSKHISKGTLTKENMQEALREIKLALLEGDVHLSVVKDLLKQIEEQAKGDFINDGLTARTKLIDIMHTELINILGKKTKELNLTKKPTVIMTVGLQGSGKTTTVGKLTKLIEKKYQKKSLLVAADIYRPAAIEQLKVLGQQLNTEVFEKGNQDPVKTVKQAIAHANDNNFDVVIIDTAGRLHIDEKLMTELTEIKKIANPTEILLVVDGMTGQTIIEVAEQFNNQLALTGVIVTKLDGDARGGATLSISHITKIPVMFTGQGEKLDQLEIFHPERMADRILGMGDVKTLVEKAQETIDFRSAEKTMRRMMLGQFDLEDLLNNMRQMSGMGKLGGIMKMIPGMPQISNDQITKAEQKMKITEVLLMSMTTKERRDPRLLKQLSRKKRITIGSGRTDKELNELINQFEKTKKQMNQMSKMIKAGKMPNLGGFGGNMPGSGFGF